LNNFQFDWGQSEYNTQINRIFISLSGIGLYSDKDGETRWFGYVQVPHWFNNWQEALYWIGETFQQVSFADEDVLIQLADHPFVMVPDSLYDENESEKYLKSAMSYWQDGVILSEHQKVEDAVCVYQVQQDLLTLFKKHLKQFRIIHHCNFLLALTKKYYQEDNNKQLFAIFRGRTLTIVYQNYNRTHYINDFYFKSPLDTLYYILLSYQEFHLDPIAFPVWLGGEIDKRSEITKNLQRYIKNINWLSEGTDADRSKYFNDLLVF